MHLGFGFVDAKFRADVIIINHIFKNRDNRLDEYCKTDYEHQIFHVAKLRKQALILAVSGDFYVAVIAISIVIRKTGSYPHEKRKICV
ncbi:MAG: hypothetical protein CFE23_13205 [Flavobacterium sp. BFFFF1]|nr:MAG: hypothetical protein CFE23_13205 [Flavobacterium sp. BFFFF1]